MCEYCNAIYYVEVQQLAKPLLAPLTHTEKIRQELINITGINYLRIKANYCPMCRKEAGRVKTILKRYVETLDNHKGIVVKQYNPTGRNIDSIHIQQENGRIWYCPISDVIYVKEESYEQR